MSYNVTKLTAWEISRLVRSGEISAVRVAKAFLARAEEDSCNAYITVMRDEALEAAKKVDSAIAAGEGEGLALAGVPVSIKDNICTAGVKTTCASRMLENFVPSYSATAYKKLLSAGAIPIGKANLDEFAIGSDGVSSCFGRTYNPFGEELIPGGSSSGSAVSLLDRSSVASLGSDTGGSARVPAALCGICSLKPTYGSVSRFGLVGMAPSLDQICPMTKDLRDNKLVFDVIRGVDVRDMTTVDHSVKCEKSPKKAGVFLPADTRGYIAANVEKAVRVLENAGVQVKAVTMPYLADISYIYYTLSSAEAASNLARFDGVRFGHTSKDGVLASRRETFGPKLSERIAEGVFVTTVGGGKMYADALALRREITDALDEMLEDVDLILSPVIDCARVKWGQTKFIGDRYTVYANITGLPALAFPFGEYTRECGTVIPLSLQLMGRRGEEDLLYSVAGKISESEVRK